MNHLCVSLLEIDSGTLQYGIWVYGGRMLGLLIFLLSVGESVECFLSETYCILHETEELKAKLIKGSSSLMDSFIYRGSDSEYGCNFDFLMLLPQVKVLEGGIYGHFITDFFS